MSPITGHASIRIEVSLLQLVLANCAHIHGAEVLSRHPESGNSLNGQPHVPGYQHLLKNPRDERLARTVIQLLQHFPDIGIRDRLEIRALWQEAANQSIGMLAQVALS